MSLRRAIEEQDAKERALLERVERLQGEIGETLASLPGGVGEKSGELFQAWSRLNVELMETRDRKWDLLSSNHFTLQFKSLSWQIERLSAFYQDIRLLMTEFLELRETLARIRKSLERGEALTPQEREALEKPLERAEYLAFERRFRREEETFEALASYVELFPPRGVVVDLGCGRGEFLELLEKSGRTALGVDSDSGMAGEAQRKGLKAITADLFAFLATLEDGGTDGFFSSQVIEHLPPTLVEELIPWLFRKVRVGGVVVLETVNPLSWFSFSQIYLLDLSHRTPVHPEALRYLCERAGFSRVEIVEGALPDRRLREVAPERKDENENIDLLNSFLFGPTVYALKAVR